MPNWVTDTDVDEVSTVDVPAHQDALFVLAKRAAPEETSVSQYFDAEGEPVDPTTLAVGDWFQDDSGKAYQWADDQGAAVTADGEEVVFQYDEGDDDGDDEVYDGLQERELETVGKSAFLSSVNKGGSDLFASLSKSLTEAISDEGARNQIAKALSDQAIELAKANKRAEDALTIAKAAQEREEQRIFVSKAAEYDGLPVEPEVLGPVLHRMTKSMSYDDCLVIAKCLERPGDLFKSYGMDAGIDIDDPFEQVQKYMEEHAGDALQEFGKSVAGPGGERQQLSKEQATTAFFSTNPREYSALKRGRR